MRFTPLLATVGLAAFVAASPVPQDGGKWSVVVDEEPEPAFIVTAVPIITNYPSPTDYNEDPAPMPTDYNEDPAPTDIVKRGRQGDKLTGLELITSNPAGGDPQHVTSVEILDTMSSSKPTGEQKPDNAAVEKRQNHVNYGTIYNEDHFQGVSQQIWAPGCWRVIVPHARSVRTGNVSCFFYSDVNCQNPVSASWIAHWFPSLQGRSRDSWKSFSCTVNPAGGDSSDVTDVKTLDSSDVTDVETLDTTTYPDSIAVDEQKPDNAAVEKRQAPWPPGSPGNVPQGTLYNEDNFQGESQPLWAPGCYKVTIPHVRSIRLGNVSCFYYTDDRCASVPVSASWQAQAISALTGRSRDSWRSFKCTIRP